MTRQEFTSKFYPYAVEATKGTKIFPETVITAAGLESNWNESSLAKVYNNYFGFKAVGSPNAFWNGTFVSLPTKEEVNGSMVTVNAKFRTYPTVTKGFGDYVRLIQTSRYVDAGVTRATNPIDQFAALQKAGYATDSKYSSKLSSIYYSIKGFFPIIPK